MRTIAGVIIVVALTLGCGDSNRDEADVAAVPDGEVGESIDSEAMAGDAGEGETRSGPYATCGFPPAQNEQCIIQPDDPPEATDQKRHAICQVEQAQCPDGYCVSYHGSQGFCSQECSEEEQCPPGGWCVKSALGCQADGSGCIWFCIKDSLAE